ncbi:MAG: hypothetical protein KGL74_06290 [Elusimicrobia bacterium]|nr:hypothetical protein [Elusimicrobiota bacterium]
MRILPLVALIAVAACSRAPRYAAFHSPLGYTVEAPAGWRVDMDPVSDRRPASTTFFADGRPLGAVLSIGRFVRRRDQVPGGPKAFADYQKGFLQPTIKLFGDDASTAARKDYSRTEKDSRVEGTAYRTPDAYFLVECRSAPQRRDLCAAALEHARATFTPTAS